MKKNIVSLLCLMCAFCNVAVCYGYSFMVDGIYYYKDGTNKCKVGCETTYMEAKGVYSGDLVIPETVVYENVKYTVTEITLGAFSKCKNLTSVTIPATVTSIARDAFYGCSSLHKVIFKDGSSTLTLDNYHTGINLANDFKSAFYSGVVDSLYIGRNVVAPTNSGGDYLFRNMTYLKYVELGKPCTTVPAHAFDNCVNLIEVKMPDELTTIGQYAFEYCEKLEKVNMPKALTTIEKYAFYKCYALKDVEFPLTLKSIGSTAFASCKTLKDVVIPNSVDTMNDYAFKDCESLQTVKVSNALAKIPICAFDNCPSLKIVMLGNGITSIEKLAFRDCTSLEDIYLFSNAITSIGTNVFPPTLKNIYVENPERYSELLGTYSLRKLINFDNSVSDYTGEFPLVPYSSNVPEMVVSLDSTKLEKDAGNYSTDVTVFFSDDKWSTSIVNNIQYTINKASLLILANDASKYEGEENPDLTYNCIGFKNGEDVSVLTTQPELMVNAGKDSPAGEYPIYIFGAEARNYQITYTNGTLSVVKKQFLIESIEFDQNSLELKPGLIVKLTANIYPQEASNTLLKWSSSNSSIVMVDSNGQIFAIGEGMAVISATSTDGSGITAMCIVTVSSPNSIGKTEINAQNVKIYDLKGNLLDKPQKGYIIVRDGNGKSMKILVK